MVLSKRKADGEFVVWRPSQAPSSSPGRPVSEADVMSGALDWPSPSKKARVNPPQTSWSATSEPLSSPLKPPAAKKPRAPRGKRASTASQPAPAPAASSSYQAGPSQQGRKKAAAGSEPSGSQAENPEKRGAMFKPRCPQNILDRVERVMTQRIFMIDRSRVDGELKEEFSVLGSTGNVYTVTIDRKPRCNCPDACKGNHCKHILFIFLKVLQVTRQSGHWYQKALLTSELQEIFAEAPLAPNSMAHAHATTSTVQATSNKNKRIPGPDDDCPVCYDGMHGVAEASLVFCEDCGNALHKECFGHVWQRTAASTSKDLTCVWCRARWVLAPPAGAAAGPSRAAGGYLNLAGVSGISPVRDTSTYYHGPRRGQRYYGYQDYGL
ncbi:hypothetical protein BDZ97DRAFT_1843889 [Flammula alnicola]|nr:hypothetical protein BDZ97DRAFT_1843889 [Flammula alnicola]